MDGMTREILFKAKLKDWKTNPVQNKWVEGFYLQRKETTYCVMEDYERNPVKTLHFITAECMTDWGLPNDFRLYEIDPDTLCQYTGIKDKNGNKVWEHDIVKINDDVKEFFQVNDGEVNYIGGCFVIGYKDGIRNSLMTIVDVYYVLRGEVIGNIFDNPELLKRQ